MARKLIILLAVTVLLIVGCQKKAEVDIAAEKAAVAAVLQNYVLAVVDEDMERYARYVSHDTGMVNFGAFGDPIVGWDGLEQVMNGQDEALSDTKIDVTDIRVTVTPSGDWAWATSLWKLRAVMGENPIELPIRCTWVLEKKPTGWVIVHFHKSTPAG